MVRLEPAPGRLTMTLQLLWFVAWLAVTTIALVLAPSPLGHGTHTQLGLAQCPSVTLFGRLCPGCGLTTSFSAFAHGNLALAFSAHPFGPLLYLGFTALTISSLVASIRGKKLQTNTRPFNLILVAFFVAFFAHGCWRFFYGPLVG